jgi:hypothetical protein
VAVPGSVFLLCQELDTERELRNLLVIQPTYLSVFIEPTEGHSDHLLGVTYGHKNRAIQPTYLSVFIEPTKGHSD